MCCVVLWKWKNSVKFNQKEWNFRRIEEAIKCYFWSWCMVRERRKVVGVLRSGIEANFAICGRVCNLYFSIRLVPFGT